MTRVYLQAKKPDWQFNIVSFKMFDSSWSRMFIEEIVFYKHLAPLESYSLIKDRTLVGSRWGKSNINNLQTKEFQKNLNLTHLTKRHSFTIQFSLFLHNS